MPCRRRGVWGEARECYLSAIELEPDAVLPYLSLGGLDELLGKMDRAEESSERPLANQPNSPMAYARLATLLRGQLPAEDLAALEARLDDPDLADGPRGQPLFAYAHVKDAHGDYGLAADCLKKANAIALEQAKDRPAYQLDQHVHYVGDLIQAFDRSLFDRLRGRRFGILECPSSLSACRDRAPRLSSRSWPVTRGSTGRGRAPG